MSLDPHGPHSPLSAPTGPGPLNAPLSATGPAPTAAPSPVQRRATLAFLLHHPAHFVALGAGAGLSPVAPGTVGTLWGWAAFALGGAAVLGPPGEGWLWRGALVLLGAVALGWWAATLTARHLGRSDPGCIVWDEIVAMWLLLWLLGPGAGWGAQAAAFVLFRFFDAAKPQPVRWADSLFKGLGPRGGWGIMWDDLVAAFCTALVLALGRRLLGWP